MKGTRHRPAAAAIAIALLLSAIAGAPAAARIPSTPRGTDPSLWAWVTARQPTSASYVPGPKDQGPQGTEGPGAHGPQKCS